MDVCDRFWDVCAAVVSALEGKDCREAIRSIADNSRLPQERLSHIVAGMHRILTGATRVPTSSLRQEVGASLLYAQILTRSGVLASVCLSYNVDMTSVNPESN